MEVDLDQRAGELRIFVCTAGSTSARLGNGNWLITCLVVEKQHLRLKITTVSGYREDLTHLYITDNRPVSLMPENGLCGIRLAPNRVTL